VESTKTKAKTIMLATDPRGDGKKMLAPRMKGNEGIVVEYTTTGACSKKVREKRRSLMVKS
jgi:hypothetical protein